MADVRITVDTHELTDFGNQLERSVAGLVSKQGRINEHIAQEIVGSARSAAYTRQTARASQSLASARSGKGASITASLRWFMGAELGALKYHQFPTWRGTVPRDPTTGGAGYFLFPTIREHAHKYVEEFGQEFLKGLNPPFH